MNCAICSKPAYSGVQSVTGSVTLCRECLKPEILDKLLDEGVAVETRPLHPVREIRPALGVSCNG